MKNRTWILTVVITVMTVKTFAQSTANPADFHGAVAKLKTYNALYVLNSSDEKRMKATIRNINNALADPRLKGKLHVELVVFGDGVEVFKKINHYDTLLTTLQKKGVLLAQCENTIRERNISKHYGLLFRMCPVVMARSLSGITRDGL